MKITGTGTSSETWLQRARTVGPEPTSAALESVAASEPLPAWDPYEVWLHRIRRHQQGRDGTGK
jgi:hypothetical protein